MSYKTVFQTLSIALPLLVFGIKCKGQEHFARFIKDAGSDRDIKSLFDSIQQPLLICQNKIYILSTECIPRGLGQDVNRRDQGGDENARNQGGDANARNQGGDVNARNQGGDVNARNQGGEVNARNQGGDVNARNQGGDVNARNQGGDVNARNQGGDVNARNRGGNANNRNRGGNINERNLEGRLSNFSCYKDKKGKLVICFYDLKPDRRARMYYNQFYHLKGSMFTIKLIKQ